MSYHYFFHEAAQEEYEDAVSWYLDKSKKAVQDFTAEVDNTLQLICENPTRWRNEYKDYFELSLKKFPYTIIYSIDTERKLINVLTFFHQKRNPKKKYPKAG